MTAEQQLASALRKLEWLAKGSGEGWTSWSSREVFPFEARALLAKLAPLLKDTP